VLSDPINRVEDGLTGETVHGGPIAAIIDTIGDYVMLLARSRPTVNFRVDYLRPGSIPRGSSPRPCGGAAAG
jgi:acyl-coenzyme A thioesterase PaaI-like protein